jgi:hopanoid C-3 methylase
MKLLLIQPPNCSPLMDQVYMFEPLALEYLGAGARLDGHEVLLVDARIDPDVDRAARDFRPDIVGLTAVTSQINIVKDIARRLRSEYPNAFFMIGGHHATVRPKDFDTGEFDAVVIGEGVVALREILTALSGSGDLSAIQGLGIPSPEGLRYTPPRPYTDLNALPFPDRTLTANCRQDYFSEWFRPLASVRTSLGCTARCKFCALWAITGGKYLRRDPDAVLAELATIQEPNVFFCDDESMCDVKRMHVLAGKIRDSGIKKQYFLYARVDTIVKHPDLFAEWAKIGLSQVFVGMEDFSDERLAAMQKGVSTSQQERAVKILNELGILMYASFMVDPDYTREDFQALKEYVRKLRLQYATFTVMTPLPGTALYAAREGVLLTKKPELCDMLHALTPPRLPLPEFYEQMARLYEGAVPLYRSLPVLRRFGMHGLLLRIKMFSAFLKKVRSAHLDY